MPKKWRILSSYVGLQLGNRGAYILSVERHWLNYVYDIIQLPNRLFIIDHKHQLIKFSDVSVSSILPREKKQLRLSQNEVLLTK